MKRALILSILCILLFHVTQPVFAQPFFSPRQIPQSAGNEKCWGWWAFKFCVKSEYTSGKLRTGIKVSSLPYAFINIVENGCFNTNPTKLLANMKYCVKNLIKPTKSNSYKASFDFQVESCLGVWRFKTCKKSSWFSFKFP